MNPRLAMAAHEPQTVVGADGLLASFNDAGVLNALDTLSAMAVSRLRGETDERAVLAAALAVRGTRFGHVCVRPATIREAVVVEGDNPDMVDSWPEPPEWDRVLASSVLVGDGTGDHPLVWVDGRLYLERYYRYEQSVARLIISRAGDDAKEIPAAAEALIRAHLDGASGQQDAALEGLRGGVTVIAGGPGTGKTYTVGVMLAARAAAGEFGLVALCAPTGKAAARLGEALSGVGAGIGDGAIAETLEGVKPSTIHRLLGWSPRRGRFLRNSTNRLPHDLVIVDEMSMVSLPMASKLLEALRDDASLVLVGDPFQLESIEAGTVLADIVGPPGYKDGPVANRVVLLERGFRFAEETEIASFANAVRSGDGDRALDLLASGGEELRWIEGRHASGFGSLRDTVVSSRIRLVELAQAGTAPSDILAELGRVAVLCAHKRGTDGVVGWSRDIEAAIDERFPTMRWKSEWYPGRPLMITKNDYNLDLYNGDIGVVANVDGALKATFERDEVRTFPLSHLTEHTTVHAMTIHKSQGSQFDEVVVVLPGEESRLLTRELLYTAVTRAKNRVWVVGSEAVIRQAIDRSVQRASGLGNLLWS